MQARKNESKRKKIQNQHAYQRTNNNMARAGESKANSNPSVRNLMVCVVCNTEWNQHCVCELSRSEGQSVGCHFLVIARCISYTTQYYTTTMIARPCLLHPARRMRAATAVSSFFLLSTPSWLINI